jgi:nucleotide-binding universal stress UspA family protein
VERSPGFNRILFAVNGSEHSAAAVPVVAAIAGKSGAKVLVLHVWNSAEDPLEHDDEMSHRRNDETNVGAVVDRLRKAGISAAGESQEATFHGVASCIGTRADSFEADLVALGNRGLAELHTFVIGSRTRQVLAEATRPVLTVRSVNRRRENPIGRVVVALDGSGDYADMVRACLDVAKPASAQVEVIHFGNQNNRPLSAVADRLAKHGVTAIWRHGSVDHAADEILTAALHPTADLLIIGAPRAGGRPPLAADLMNRLLQSCPCPLMVVPARDLTKTRYAPLSANSGTRPNAV